MSEKKIFSVDRFEGELAVCVSDNDDVVVVPMASLDGMHPRDIFSAFQDGDELNDITPMPEERDRRLKEIHARLHALKKGNKN